MEAQGERLAHPWGLSKVSWRSRVLAQTQKTCQGVKGSTGLRGDTPWAELQAKKQQSESPRVCFFIPDVKQER